MFADQQLNEQLDKWGEMCMVLSLHPNVSFLICQQTNNNNNHKWVHVPEFLPNFDIKSRIIFESIHHRPPRFWKRRVSHSIIKVK